MEFRVLGQLDLRDGDRRIDLGPPRLRTLLALLLVHHGTVVSTDRIIEELWGDDGDHRNAVWVQVSNLRSVLEPDRPARSEGSILLTRSPGYLLDVDPDDIDALRFERMTHDGRALLDSDPEAASKLLRDALALWRGRAYEEFTYESFASTEIERLDELRLQAIEARIDADLARGHTGELVSELLTLTRRHPLHERFTAQLMLAEHRSGRRAEALRAFRALRTRLATELGLDPSIELRELEARILRDDPALRTRPGGHHPGRPVSGLAVRGYELRRRIGRTELGAVHLAYQPDVGREVAITSIPAELADEPAFIRRFEGAARSVAALEHPNIVPLYDYWREPGAAYLVSRLMRGGNLADVLRTRALDHDETLRLVDDVASALDAAHARGVVHGHIDERSILFDEAGRASLSGFGIAPPATTAAQRADAEARDFAALATVVAQAMTGLAGPLPAIEGALPPPVAEVLRAAADRLPSRPRTATDLAAGLHQALRGRDEPVGALRPGPPAANPYRGLAAFGQPDADVFFGRERVVDRLVGRLAEDGPGGRFVALVGPSGSGKSSAVMAGLLPALERDRVPGSSTWFVTSMTPGPHPFESLEAALLKVSAAPPPALVDELTSGEDGLRIAMRNVLPDDDAELLLVIDQFEEAFTLADPTVVDGFLDAITAAIEDEAGRLRVVATLRADFYDRPLRHRGVGELLRRGTEVITPMSPSELERAITEPAARAGVSFAPSVVAELIAAVEGRPGTMPLLQYALTELFERRTDDVIDEIDYHAAGGLSGAIAARAESIFAAGDPREQDAARQVFLRLVTLGEGVHDTRRRALVAELTDLPVDRRAVVELVERYTRHRLLTGDRDPVTRSPTVEISHEALLDEWTRLRNWVDAARDDLRHQRRLRAAMGEWEAAGRPDDHLLSGGELVRLRAWAVDSDVRLGDAEEEYLDRSIAEHDRRIREAEEQEADRRAVEGRARRRLAYSVVAMSMAVVIALLALVAIDQRRAAQRSEETIAATLRSQDLAAASVVQLRSDPDLASRLALAAASATADLGFVTPEALDALHWSIQEADVPYPADETTPVAVRPGPLGATGVFALAPDIVVDLAQGSGPGRFTAQECAEYFAGRACPDPAASMPDGLELQGGEEDYGVVAADSPGALDGTQVEVLDTYGTADGPGAEYARFSEITGITLASPQLQGVGDELARREREQQPLPDLVVWPQPGSMADRPPGSLIDLSTYLDTDQLRADFGSTLMSLATVGEDGSWPAEDGAVVGLPIDVDVKGLVFYARDDFERAGYAVPATYDELVRLSDRIAADGGAPWCFGFGGSGEADGWPGTDLVETMVLREGGPELYDAWASHEVPFDAPEIRAAAARAETLLLTDGWVRGGSDTISLRGWTEEMAELTSTPPGCWMLHMADYALAWKPVHARLGVDIDVFPFPPLQDDDQVPVNGGGSMISVLADRPETRTFIRYAAAPTWGEEWAAHGPANFLSPNARFDQSAYGRDAGPEVAALYRSLGEIAQAAVADGTYRFDASDLMPGAIGAFAPNGTRGAFWQGMLDVVDGVRSMDEVLTRIEATWVALESR